MGALFALAIGLFWAAYNIAVRSGLQRVDGGAGYLVTQVLGAVANLGFLLLPLPGRGGTPNGMAVLWFILAGFSTTLMGRWLYFRSVEVLGPSRASAWKSAAPVYTLILGAILLGERPGLLAVAGTTSVMAGLLLLSREQARLKASVRVSGSTHAAIWLGIASGAAFSAGMLLRKAGLNFWPDAAVGSAIGALVALGAYLPFAVIRGEVKAVFRAPAAGLGLFFLAGILGSLAQLSTFLSLRFSHTATTHVIAALEPMFTMFLSVLLLGRQEELTRSVAGSAILICSGVVLMTVQ